MSNLSSLCLYILLNITHSTKLTFSLLGGIFSLRWYMGSSHILFPTVHCSVTKAYSCQSLFLCMFLHRTLNFSWVKTMIFTFDNPVPHTAALCTQWTHISICLINVLSQGYQICSIHTVLLNKDSSPCFIIRY